MSSTPQKQSSLLTFFNKNSPSSSQSSPFFSPKASVNTNNPLDESSSSHESGRSSHLSSPLGSKKRTTVSSQGLAFDNPRSFSEFQYSDLLDDLDNIEPFPCPKFKKHSNLVLENEQEQENPYDKPSAFDKTNALDKPNYLQSFSAFNNDSPFKSPSLWIGSPPILQKNKKDQEWLQGLSSDSGSFDEKDAKKADYSERYSWLEFPRDLQLRSPEHPDYNPRTLYIPPEQWARFTPFEKQFWEIKSLHFDIIVFFKKGKFYELYERDAEIGACQFDLKLTDRVNMKMVGVPEATLEFWISKFISGGYKVARVDQIETSIGKSLREKSTTKTPLSARKEDKIIKRELTAILTAGTLTDPLLLSSDMSNYCISIKESLLGNSGGSGGGSSGSKFSFGLAIVDASTSEFSLCYLKNDDSYYSLLETMILQLKPKEILYEKGVINSKTLKTLKSLLPGSILTGLEPDKEFWDSKKTTNEIERMGYFAQVVSTEATSEENPTHVLSGAWPSALTQFKDNALVMSAFGALVFYLRLLKLDSSCLGFKNFKSYDPLRKSDSLILDGQSLVNLEIFQNSFSHDNQGTLFKIINFCLTPFGKRLLKKWTCHPLKSIVKIEERLNITDYIYENEEFKTSIASLFPKLPDLERLLSRIHSGTAKLKEFLSLLDYLKLIYEFFKTWTQVFDSLHSNSGNSDEEETSDSTEPAVKSLRKLLARAPDLTHPLELFGGLFDKKKALEEGIVIPIFGSDPDYDQIITNLHHLQSQLDNHLVEVEKKLGLSDTLKYKDINNTIYQIEIPSHVNVPSNWILMSKTKSLNRFWTPFIKEVVGQLEEAKELKNIYLNSFFLKLLKKFDVYKHSLLALVQVLSELDCLYSFYQCRKNMGSNCCRPVFFSSSSQPSFFHAQNLSHPCLVSSTSRINFIPNDIRLGKDFPRLVILTGPNMGGKSTLLRQTCLAVILAQLGCYLPASSCEMSLFDRIFTRIGAHDNIMAGQSTFMIELDETSKILREATCNSLVILDELGRGTSTFDGYAIAYSVLHYLKNYIGCLGLFSTHYRTLTQEFRVGPGSTIGVYHMDCTLDQANKRVVFLYKLCQGICPKSYGMNVAYMAGVPSLIVEKAQLMADEMEASHKLFIKPKDLQEQALSIDLLTDLFTLFTFQDSLEKDNPKPSIETLKRIIDSFK